MAEDKKDKPKIDWKAINVADAIKFVRDFYSTSYNWRAQAYHSKWNTCQNNYLSIYPPELKSRKEPWQSCMFIPETFKVIEVICAALVKIFFSRKRPVGLEPRERGDELQAELHTDLLDYELDRSNFIVTFYDVLKEALIYGSGFMKLYWLQKKDKRRIKVPQKRGYSGAFKEALKGNFGAANPAETIGYNEEIQSVYVKENVVCERVHIRDIFLEPNSTDLQRILHRTKITYGELLDLSKQTNGLGEPLINPDTVLKLRDVIETPDFEQSLQTNSGNDSAHKFDPDSQPAAGQQGITFPTPIRAKFDKQHSIFEFWGPVPRRFIELGLDGNSDEGNEIVPGKIMIASGGWFLASEENPNQSMEPPFLQVDYCRIGQTYGLGVAQIMSGLQEEIDEIRNQRVDNVNLILNKMVAVLEKGLVNPEELVSRPGSIIRLHGDIRETDIRRILMPIEFPDITLSAYRETQELQIQIQEATGANRVTVGTAGQTRDTNQTATGMELLKQSAADRFVAVAYIIGKAFLLKVAPKMMEYIYQNRSPESIARILGDRPVEILPGEILSRSQAFKLLPPHELCQDYDFVIVDSFNEENKAMKKQSLASDLQLTAGILPQFNPYPGLKKIYALDGFENDEITEILGDQQGQIATPLAQGIGQPSQASPTQPMLNAMSSPSTPMPGSGMANPGM